MYQQFKQGGELWASGHLWHGLYWFRPALLTAAAIANEV
jgi:hypothetical protein